MRRTSGLSLLILIFVSLCLITFSLLSVSESRADQAPVSYTHLTLPTIRLV